VALKFGSEVWVLKKGDKTTGRITCINHTDWELLKSMGKEINLGQTGCRKLFGEQNSINKSGYSGHKMELLYHSKGEI
jgi:hypothetical protein